MRVDARLTGTGNSGIMHVSSDGRRNEKPLTSEQVKECRQIAIEYGMPTDKIIFSENMFTGYFPFGDSLYIGTDVYPCGNNKKANYMISCKGVLAHELIGHRNAYLKNGSQGIERYEEAQASIRAAKLAKGLSDDERKILLQDAAERLHDDETIESIRSLLFLRE